MRSSNRSIPLEVSDFDCRLYNESPRALIIKRKHLNASSLRRLFSFMFLYIAVNSVSVKSLPNSHKVL
jgi:hypothetical protein